MKTAVAIPDPLFRDADRLARRLGLSRSRFYAEAVQALVRSHAGESVTEALDRVYAKVPSRVDPVLAALQATSIESEPW